MLKLRTLTGRFLQSAVFAPVVHPFPFPPCFSAADQYMQHISTLVAPACSALALAAGADTLWRSLNYALLMYDIPLLSSASVLYSHFPHAHARRGASCALRCAGLCGRFGQQLARGGALACLIYSHFFVRSV